METPICPKCKVEMVLKDGRYGKFWGCPNYSSKKKRSCKHTIDYKATIVPFTVEYIDYDAFVAEGCF